MSDTMGLFAKKAPPISITTYFMETTNKYGFSKIIILKDEEAKEKLDDEKEKEKVKTLNTKWRNITWKEQNDLVDECIKKVKGEDDSFDLHKFRDKRIKRCLLDWDAQQGDGSPIPITEEVIDSMDADFMQHLVNQYEEAVSFDKEEEGKS